MSKTVRFSRRLILVQNNHALSQEVGRRFIFVEVREYRRQVFTAMKVHGRLKGFGVHIDDEVSIQSKKETSAPSRRAGRRSVHMLR